METDEKQINKIKDMEKLITIMCVITAVILLVILIIVKINVNLKTSTFVFAILGIIIFFAAIIYASMYISNKLALKKDKEEEEKLPKAISFEQAHELALDSLTNTVYADNFILETETTHQIGKGQKSTIYEAKGYGYFSGQDYYILINLHFPNDKRAILMNPSEQKLNYCRMTLATHPEEAPNVKETKRTNQLLGTEETIVETSRDAEEKKEEKKEIKEEKK